jgi:hypothetical protein
MEKPNVVKFQDNTMEAVAQANNAPTVRIYCKKHMADAEYFSALSKQYLCY